MSRIRWLQKMNQFVNLPVSMRLLLGNILWLIFAFQLRAQPAFAPMATYSVGYNPKCVVAADVNGDGKIDLVTANDLGNSLSILTNKGNGTFKLLSTIATSSALSVVAVDLNGDGKKDLACGNAGPHTVSVFTNTAAGVFVLASTTTVANQPWALTATDFNNDGKPDLVTANYNSAGSDGDSVSILTNGGNGQFTVLASPLGQAPFSVASADFNEDGLIDLISGGGGYVKVLRNKGGGQFTNAPFPHVTGPQMVVVADVNGDDHVDVITANTVYDLLSVLTNDGHGNFTLTSSPYVAGGPNAMDVADVNGDGKVDLIVGNYYGNIYTDDKLTVLTNDGSGGFVFATSMLANAPTSVVAVDVNGDGKVDLIDADWLSRVEVFISVPTLQINRSNEMASVSWPSSWSNSWTLQQNSDLSGTNWTSYGGTISNDGTNKTATSSLSGGGSFFRLVHP